MATTDFIAAIELSSSKISGIAGKKNSDGSIQVLAYAREDASSFIHKGVIYNIDKTAQALTSIINKLEGQLNNSIAKVYVGIGGQSLRTVKNAVSRTLEEEDIISQELVDSICDENLEVPLADMSVLDVQKQIRSIPKPVIAAVNGFAIGGGHVLHVVCDLSIASENAVFGQTGPRVGSFDAGFGASYLARVVGQKKAREIWFLCRKYNAQEALEMGLVNKVVPLEQLEDEYVQWAEEMMQLSPLALRMIKAGLNAELDGQSGIQELAGDATLLYYLTDEAQEGKNAFLEKRKPNFKQYPKFP